MTAPLSGSRAWLAQRLSALYLAAFILYLLVRSAGESGGWSYESWRAWVLSPSVRIASLLFFAALLFHAWVGLRDVLLDYIHPAGLRIALLALVVLALAATAAWAAVMLFTYG